MTDMKRISVSFPDDIAEKMDKLKRTKAFAGRPYSELIRHLIELGLQAEAKKAH